MSQTAERRLHRRVEQVMGMPISLALDGRHAGTPTGERAWQDALASLREVDAVFSTYRDDSAISRLGRGETTLSDCPAEVAEVLDLAEAAREESGGAFDVRRPGPDGGRVLDPSGIVKGWAVDRAAHVLRSLEETDFCLSAGGDMVCVTKRTEAPRWRIGIEDPRDPARVLAVVPVRDGAVATSGLTHRGAHVLDPRTGTVPRDLLSVTVVAHDLVTADVDATAALVLGADALAWLALRPGRSGLVVTADGHLTTFGPTGGSPGQPRP